MEKFNWMSTLTVNLWILRTVGIWPGKNKSYESKWYTLYFIFNATLLIGVQNFTQIINIFFVYTDLEALAGTCFILATNFLGLAKMLIFVRNLRSIHNILEILDSDEAQPKSTEQIKLVQPSLKRWKMSYFVFMSYVSSNLLLWLLVPLLSEGYQLPLVSWYPFSVEKSPNYEIVFMYQVFSFTYISAANINVDAFFYALLMFIWAQCDILCDNLSHLDGDPAQFNQKLINCVKHHAKIVRFAKKSNSLIDMIILGQFATSTMALALTMFQLSLVETVNQEALVSLLYIMGIMIQLFIYCWFGTEVEIKSSKIPYAVYVSQWYDQPLNAKKNMLILSQRCQRPIQITAINLFALSLNTFINIIRTAWSYFVVLYNVHQYNLDGTVDEFKKKLEECVNHHKEIVRFANSSNSVFNIILGQLMTSTMVLALTLFQLSLVESFVSQETLPHFCYLTGISMELFFYCWFGNEVEIKSSGMPFALYKSNWCQQPLSVQKSMLIMSLRCQDPITISALNLFPLSLRNFVTILRTAWSYFAR
ncbi:hypothetical protein Zmor_007667 [Zophobas morio]|uniref:Odorant receptor n=1 Tax=Zophobas morio TaxID=2755281 RepID=A0AA38IZM2_9CUCU|nr:hypothetical protein Zmor_007667 [Zophobas morio]